MKFDSPRNKSPLRVMMKEEAKGSGSLKDRSMDIWEGIDQHTIEDANWYELRVQGMPPERRAYHSSFVYNSK